MVIAKRIVRLLAVLMVLTLGGCTEEQRDSVSYIPQPDRDPALVGAWSRDTFPPDPYEYVPGVANTLSFQSNGNGADWWRSVIVGPGYTIMFEETTRILSWHTSNGVLHIDYNDSDMDPAWPYWFDGTILFIRLPNSVAEFSRL